MLINLWVDIKEINRAKLTMIRVTFIKDNQPNLNRIIPVNDPVRLDPA